MLVIPSVAQRSRGIPPCYENLPILGRRGFNQRARCPLAPQPRCLCYTACSFAQIVENKLPVCALSGVTLHRKVRAAERILGEQSCAKACGRVASRAE